MSSKGLGKAATTRGSESRSSKPRGNDGLRTKKPRTGALPRSDALANPPFAFEPRPDWHAAQLPDIELPNLLKPVSREKLEGLYDYAVSLLEIDNSTYEAKHLSSTSSHKFLSTIMSSGTMEDRVSALTLLIQESPLHTRKSFEQLLNLARKKSRGQALMALSALKDLLGQGVVLPPDRKLRYFYKQPGLWAAFQGKGTGWTVGSSLPNGIGRMHLVSWAFEDWLKRTYFEILKVLEGWCNDEVQYAKSRALTYVWELLREKPEQEENLLRLLINKLGDTDRKIGSRASYLLLQLQNTHPSMKLTIVNSIEAELLLRPGQSAHARYYAIVTLNQTILSGKEPDLANKLVKIYFDMFLGLLNEQKTNHVLEGARMDGAQRRNASTAAGTQNKKARARKQQSKSITELTDRMIAQVLAGVNRAFPYAETDSAAFDAQLDTLFRATHSFNFNTSMQALMLIQQISNRKPHVSDRFYRTLYESLLDPRLITSSKQVMYLNLLYKSLKADVSIKRVKAFVKRLLQVMTLHEPPFISGVLYLINELKAAFPSLDAMLVQPEAAEEDEEEKFYDVLDTAAHLTQNQLRESNLANEVPQKNRYDPRRRDPEHSNAECACLWEILPFESHFHPSVSLFATHFLSPGMLQKPPAKPDPSAHTLIHFLDRFVYRNPKTKVGMPGKGSSIMQPLAGNPNARDLLYAASTSTTSLTQLNTEGFWRKDEADIDASELFFHRYFATIGKTKKLAKSVKRNENRDQIERVQDEEEGEEEIWDALVKSRPELEGADMDDDEHIEDFEDDEDEDLDDIDHATTEDDGDEGVRQEDRGGAEEEVQAIADEELLDLEEEDALLSSDEDVPQLPKPGKRGLGDDAEEASSSKQKAKRRRKLKDLPTFASVDDYATLLAGEDDGM